MHTKMLNYLRKLLQTLKFIFWFLSKCKVPEQKKKNQQPKNKKKNLKKIIIKEKPKQKQTKTKPQLEIK